MKELTPQQIEQNWNKLRNIIQDTFEGERLDNLNKMYDHFEDRMCMAPASGKEHFHYAHVGGYVEHVLHIIDYSKQLNKIETGLKEVKQAVENSGTHIDFEGLEYRIETRVINQVKQITKHKKRIC